MQVNKLGAVFLGVLLKLKSHEILVRRIKDEKKSNINSYGGYRNSCRIG